MFKTNLNFGISGFNVATGGGFDPDAQAYIDKGVAGGDANLEAAINTFVVGLKDEGIWDKRHYIYPYFGGTAALHAWNLRDLNNFNMIWSGSITHDANGWQGLGNGFGRNGYIPSAQASLNNTGVSSYSRTVNAAINIDIGALDAGANRYYMYNLNATNLVGDINTTNNFGGVTITNQLGLSSVNRTASNVTDHYKNGVFIAPTNTQASVALTTVEAYFGARNNNGSADFFSGKQYVYQAGGEALTASEQLAEYNLVQALQIVANRQA